MIEMIFLILPDEDTINAHAPCVPRIGELVALDGSKYKVENVRHCFAVRGGDQACLGPVVEIRELN